MEPRMRAGMIAGAGAAVAAFFLSFVVFCLGGLLVAIISGLSAGLQIARDQRFAREAGAAGALAGLYAGVVLGVGQILGMLLTAALFRDQLQAQLASQGYSNNLFWPTLIIACLFVGALEVGITVGGGALAAFYAARRLYGVAAASVLRYAPTYPPAYAPVPLPDATPAPAPPPARPLPPYLPPPSFYGAPPKGVTSVDDNSADASPATAEM
jgi:hypothetical protein